MANVDEEQETPGERGREALFRRADDAAFYIPLIALGFHVYGVATGDLADSPVVAGLFATVYVLLMPLFIWRVRRRKPAGDALRAAAILPLGALPLPLAVIPGTPFTDWPGGIFTLPLVVAAAVVAVVLAVRSQPPPRTARSRALLLGSGALAYLAMSVGAFSASLSRDEVGRALGDIAFLFVLGIPVALVCLAAGVKVAGEALKLLRPPPASPALSASSRTRRSPQVD